MQCRRRWTPVALFAIVATTGANLALGALTAAQSELIKNAAKELEAAKGEKAVEAGLKVVNELENVKGPIDRNKFGKEVVGEFERLAKSKVPDVQLNAAMTIARMHTISTDAALIRLLPHPNPSVRYWAAKGLGEISNLKAVNGQGNAIAALQAQLAKETSAVVKKEIVRAIAALGTLTDMIKVLQILSVSMQAQMPDQGTVDAVTLALDETDTAAHNAPKDSKDPNNLALNAVELARHAASLVSFATQHEFAARTKDPAAVSDGYHAAVVNLVNSAVKVLNTAALGKGNFVGVTTDSKPEEFLLLVNGIVGSGAVPGQVQKAFPGVTIPPAVKGK